MAVTDDQVVGTEPGLQVDSSVASTYACVENKTYLTVWKKVLRLPTPIRRIIARFYCA